MANNRRMVSRRITKSSRFLMMPNDVQLLYFHILTDADDDGVVEVYPLIRLLGVPSDNLKVLLAKDFVRQINEDQVIVVTHWTEHNVIRADRKTNSIYLDQVKELYPEMEFVEPKPRSDVKGHLDSPRTDKARLKLSKVKLSKDNNIDHFFAKFWIEYPRKVGKVKALLSFKTINPDNNLLDAIIKGVKEYTKTEQWKADGGAYIPNPATFLNQRRWEDEIPKDVPRKPKKQKVYYRGDPVVEKNNKLYVIRNGDWLEFAGDKKDLEYEIL